MSTAGKQITVSIGYLDHVEIESGAAAEYGDGRHVDGRFVAREPTRAVEPTIVTITVSDDRIATVYAGWGDRVRRGETPPIWGELIDGTRWGAGEDGSLRLDDYPATDDALRAAIHDARRQVAEAWLAAIADRPDVAAIVEHYRAAVLDRLDAESAALQSRWAVDAVAIAREFRRTRVEIGEQTVPGKCCVRGSRGAMLGYAHVWDGQWLGTVERA